jgi:isochorismate synthase
VNLPGYVTRAERRGPSFDLIAGYEPEGVFFGKSGLGAAGAATAFRYVFGAAGAGAPDVTEMLERTFANIARDDTEPDSPLPLVFVSVPFDPSRAGSVVLPARTVRRDREGETWQLTILPLEQDLDVRTPPERFVGRAAAPHEAFSGMQLRPVPAPDTYCRAVSEVIGRIREGELRKVVLARTIEVAAGRRLDPTQLLWRLRAVDPDCYAFAFPTENQRPRILVGASPELLVSRRGLEVRSEPLAGSAPRSGDPGEDRASGKALLASAKDREEHAIVVEAIEETLEPLCEDLQRDPEPVLLATANVWHLATRFRGRLREPVPDALSLAIALHPTPAVCGTPRSVASRVIREFEPFERDGYAGPVGWVDAAGDGEFALALRCAELRDDEARLFAGAGIVADSDPTLELDETERKFRALLDALRWS